VYVLYRSQNKQRLFPEHTSAIDFCIGDAVVFCGVHIFVISCRYRPTELFFGGGGGAENFGKIWCACGQNEVQ
jgi:hypothetical protein